MNIQIWVYQLQLIFISGSRYFLVSGTFNQTGNMDTA